MNYYHTHLQVVIYMNKEFKSGFIAILGRPNVGKSTILNQMMDQKVAIVTSKAQTTRNKIQGIYTTDEVQMIFIDTPGIHKPKNELGNFMNQTAFSSLDGIDLVLFVADGSEKIGTGDVFILENLKKVKVPVILVVNKVDLLQDKEEVLKENIESYKNAFSFSGGITLSASHGFNIDKLKEMIIERLDFGPMYYPEDQLLDQPERFVVAELIREKVLLTTSDEVPHSVAVKVESFKEKQNGLIEILADIVVERPSQKKIIIGKNGTKIKEIGTLARKEIVKFLGSKVYLELFVKVETDWRNKVSRLKEYGYRTDEV